MTTIRASLPTLLRLVTVVASVLLFPFEAASANDSLKQALFEDCDAAMTQLSTVPPEEQLNILEYIVGVLKLNTQVPDFPAAYWVQPGIPKPGEPAPSALWQAVDAKRELEAKRCALKLLEKAGAGAIRILPALVSLYSEENLGDEIAVGIEEAGVEIAEQAKLSGIVLAGTELDQIIRALSSSRPLLAQNILIEYRSIALPRLLASLSQLSDEESKKALDFLHQIDPSGLTALTTLKHLAAKLNPDQLDRLARFLPLPSDLSALKAVDDLAAVATSNDPGIARSFIILVSRLCVKLNGVTLPPKVAATFAGRPLVPLLSEGFVSLDEQRCLTSSIKGLAPSVLSMLADSSPSAVLHALHLMPSVVRHLSGKARSAAYSKVKALALPGDKLPDTIPPIPTEQRDAALQVLSAFPEHASQTAAVYQEWIKKRPSSDFPVGILEGIRKLPESASARFAPFLVSLLEQQKEPDSVVQALGAGQIPLESELKRLIKLGADKEVRQLFKALSLQKTPRLSDIEVVAASVGSLVLGEDASNALIRIGKKSISPLRERLATLPTPNRPMALGPLVAIGTALPAEIDELKRFLIQGTCSELERYRLSVDKLLASPQATTQDPLSLTPRIIACLPALPTDIVASWVQASALIKMATCDLIEPLLYDPASTETIISFALTPLIERGFSDPKNAELAQRALSTAPRLAKIAILKQLLASGGPPSLNVEIRLILEQATKDPELFAMARCALARLGDSNYNWQPFIRETVEQLGQGLDAPLEMDALQYLPVDLVLTQLSVALKSGYIPITVGAARVASAMAQSASSIAPQLRELLRDHSPPIRYASALALFHVDSSPSILLDPVRRVLVNRYFQPNRVDSPTAEQIELFTALSNSGLGVLREERLSLLTGKHGFSGGVASAEPEPGQKSIKRSMTK
jgi:hypothetical protein